MAPQIQTASGLVQLLIDSGAALDQRGVNDWTPLHYAASSGDADAIRLLGRATLHR